MNHDPFKSARCAWSAFLAVRNLFFIIGIMAILAFPTSANAQYATGGTGLHRGRILWIDWGNNGENVVAGKTIVRTTYVDTPNGPSNRLDITCTLSNAVATRGTAGLFVYASGTWQGDGLDELYNIGGNQPGQGANPNTLSAGLRTNGASTMEFDFSCSAVLGGSPFPLTGLVFADAEASGGTEYVAARLTGGGQLRIIDQISQCGSSSTVNVVAGVPQEVRLQGPTAPQASCEGNATPLRRAGPSLVGFIDGATSARVIARGGGISAVAVGAMIELEYSEGIPNSYGNASHVLDATWTGGLATSGVNFNNPANLSTGTYQTWLGATIQADADANGAIGGSDVDALPKVTGTAGVGYANVTAPQGPAGTAYSITNVSCSGPGFVAAWIDFNGNGAFDVGEKSGVVACPAGASSVNLSWTIPVGGTVPQATSFLRIRASSTIAGVANPSGVVLNGEAEDYRIVVGGARLALSKAWSGAVANDNTVLSSTGLTNNIVFPAITVSGNDTQSSAQVNVYAGETASLSEILGVTNAGAYNQLIACTGAVDTNLADGLTIATADTNIVCTFTNTRKSADFSVAKSNGVTSVNSGGTTIYTLTVTNNGPDAATGAVVTDSPTSGLVCPAANPVTITGNGVPAGSFTVADLTGTGIALANLTAGQSAVLTFSCTVP